MARTDKDTMQNNILNGFEKSNRENSNSTKPLTLAEQIEQAKIEEESKKYKKFIPKTEEIEYGNLEYDTYIANKKLMEAKKAGKK